MPRCLKPLARGLFLLGLLATPAMAQEELNGYPITDVNLRAGPGTEYPLLVTVPTDAPITILGCLEDYTWCDTIFEQYRGWMRSIYLAGYYDGEYYLLSDYAPDLGYQVLTFDRAAYWDAYYQDEPFYDDRSRVTEARGEDWVDDGVFYDRLSPHGSWTWTQGQYVWVPTGVDAGWRPYTRGRWVYTDHGWTWASDEPFGWATYHYGRWGFSNRIGWFWVPGNRWGTAWVSWRQSDDYLAWAPLPPAYDRGLNVNVSFGNIPGYYWSVVPSLYFLSDDLPRHYVRDRARWRSAYDRTRPIGHTTIVNKTVVNTVVNVNYVERHTNTKVVERQVRRTRDWDRAGKIRGDDYEVYRPGLQEGRGRHRPDKPRDIDDVAKESKTRGLARGEVATDDLLAPPEVREALKKRKGGRVRGEDSVRGAATVRGEVSVRGKDSGPSARSPGKTDGPKYDRRLPKGRDAEGPPPARKNARAAPVPAQDLGPSKAGSKGKPRKQKLPGVGTPTSGAPSGAPPGAGNKLRRGETRSQPAGEPETTPSVDRGVKGQKGLPAKPKSPPQAKQPKQDPSGQKASPGKPAAKRAPPERQAKPNKPKGPSPQANPPRQDPSGQKAPSGKPAAKKPPPEQQAKPEKQEAPVAKQAPPKQQAKPNKPKAPVAKKPPPKQQAKPNKPKAPVAKKPPPKQQAKPNKPKAPVANKPPPKQQAKPNKPKAPAAKKPPPKQQAKPNKPKAPAAKKAPGRQRQAVDDAT